MIILARMFKKTLQKTIKKVKDNFYAQTVIMTVFQLLIVIELYQEGNMAVRS